MVKWITNSNFQTTLFKDRMQFRLSMKKVHAILFSFLMITMSMAGCLSGDTGADGEEGVAGPVGEAGSSLHLVVTADELPDCNTTLLGQIFFVSGEGAFQVCSTTGWAVVDLTGPEGPAGARRLGCVEAWRKAVVGREQLSVWGR